MIIIKHRLATLTLPARKKSERPIAQPYVWPLALQARQTATDCAWDRLS